MCVTIKCVHKCVYTHKHKHSHTDTHTHTQTYIYADVYTHAQTTPCNLKCVDLEMYRSCTITLSYIGHGSIIHIFIFFCPWIFHVSHESLIYINIYLIRIYCMPGYDPSNSIYALTITFAILFTHSLLHYTSRNDSLNVVLTQYQITHSLFYSITWLDMTDSMLYSVKIIFFTQWYFTFLDMTHSIVYSLNIKFLTHYYITRLYMTLSIWHSLNNILLTQ